MNELFAIIIIVFLCCAVFFAWLISMATCPDRMVDLISGNSSQQESSSSSSPTTSKELISGSNSPNSKRQNINQSRGDKQKKKYNTTLFQLSAPFKQRMSTRNQRETADSSSAGGRSNTKKLSVVPEQDEQLTINSKSSQPRYSISIMCAQEPLIEHPNEHSHRPSSINEPQMMQLVPFVAPTVIPMPVERCVEDVIDARRRQRQVQLLQSQQQQHWYNDHGTRDSCEEDTIFLLPPRYELLHASLAESDEARADADAISLPNSPRSSSAGISTAVEARLQVPLFHHNQNCHSETHIYIPPNETTEIYEYTYVEVLPSHSKDIRRHSLCYMPKKRY